MPAKQPAELLTIANHILGTGQLSLAKFLFITAEENRQLSVLDVEEFMMYMLERIDLTRDIHFYTNTTMDTLDYSGISLNSGSKVVFAAYGETKRELCTEVPSILSELHSFDNPLLVMPGVVALEAKKFATYEAAKSDMKLLNDQLYAITDQLPIFIIICDDAEFVSANLRNYLWVTYTRTNPSHDIYGINSFIENKHWGCEGPLIFDARIKPHHAPPVELVPEIEKKTDKLFEKGGSLYRII
jgi:4-hydroxy-3-polyprenylbenzoate decarboxylase